MKNNTDYENMAMKSMASAMLECDAESDIVLRFADIVSGFDVLDDVDVSGVGPLVSVLDTSNVMREDVAVKVISRDELLKNAPEHNDGYVQVPAAID